MCHHIEKPYFRVVRETVAENFMEKTQSLEWLIPTKLVKKPNGSWRFCLDLTLLNLLVQQDNYPLPNPQTIFDQCYNKKIFSVLDITNGFLQSSIERI